MRGPFETTFDGDRTRRGRGLVDLHRPLFVLLSKYDWSPIVGGPRELWRPSEYSKEISQLRRHESPLVKCRRQERTTVEGDQEGESTTRNQVNSFVLTNTLLQRVKGVFWMVGGTVTRESELRQRTIYYQSNTSKEEWRRSCNKDGGRLARTGWCGPRVDTKVVCERKTTYFGRSVFLEFREFYFKIQ